jgi:hypothetical protein
MQNRAPLDYLVFAIRPHRNALPVPSLCQYRFKIPHSTDRKIPHLPEKMVYSFSRLVENGTGW